MRVKFRSFTHCVQLPCFCFTELFKERSSTIASILHNSILFLFLEQCNQIESTVAAIYSSTSKKESRRFYKRLPNKTRSNNHFTQTYMVKIYVKWKKARNPRYHYYLRKFIHNHMRGRVESFVHLCKSRRGLQHQRRLRTMLQKLSKCEVMA